MIVLSGSIAPSALPPSQGNTTPPILPIPLAQPKPLARISDG